jgi:hypothetical protein
MILDALKDFDNRRAAGILSRAALELESGGVNPAAEPVEANEIGLRRKIIDELARSIRKSSAQSSETEIGNRIIGDLDAAIANLLEPRDETAAIERLSRDAALPSDAYQVTFDKHIAKEFLPRVSFDDRQLVQKMIRAPEFQEDFGPTLTPREPAPVSLFGSWYNFGRPRDRFLLIAAASRDEGQKLFVKQFWRVYASAISLHGVQSLADVFERLTSKYGVEFKVVGWQGKFLRHHIIHAEQFKFIPIAEKTAKGDVVITQFFMRRVPNGPFEFSFGVAINLREYNRDCEKHIKFERAF